MARVGINQTGDFVEQHVIVQDFQAYVESLLAAWLGSHDAWVVMKTLPSFTHALLPPFLPSFL